MSTRRITTSAAAAALALLASACSDRLTAPAAHPAERALTTSASGVTLVPNSVRYADTGGKPATGRAGSAALDALALLGRDGYTDLELRARAADPARDVQGTVTRAQVKAFAESGRLLFTRSAAGGQAPRFAGLLRGGRVEVQANVTGIDPHRTDVVVVAQTVMLRPDLRVQAVTADSVAVGTPLVVVGEITELNGDLGARADCVLLVDGVPVDEARGVWVDAGDRVSCAFTIPSLAAGTHQVTVRAEGVAPGDWNTANNASTVQVVASAPVVPMWHMMEVRTGQSTAHWGSRHLWYDEYNEPDWREDGGEHWTYANEQRVSASGWIGRGFTAPLSIRLVETNAGQQLQDDSWTMASSGSPWLCTNRFNTAAGTGFYFCTVGGASNFQFFRSSGTVTYHSRVFGRQWDGATGEETYSYHFDSVTHTGTAPVAIAVDYRVSVQLGSDPDALSFTMGVDYLRPWEAHDVYPEECQESGDVEWGYFERSCTFYESEGAGLYGTGYAQYP